MIYKQDGANLLLEGLSFGDGRILSSGSGQEVNYFLTDHLGSVRAIVNGTTGQVVERNDYYPFGGRYLEFAGGTGGNRFKYNGKEIQITGDLNYLDYGARMYDTELGRWFGVDPMGKKYYGMSSYNYCGNNPILFIDPDGQMMDWFVDADGSLFYDPAMRRGDENKLGDTWSWLGPNGMFSCDDNLLILKYSSLVSEWGFRAKEILDWKTGKLSLQWDRLAFLERDNAMKFMDKQGYKYLMTQFTEYSKTYKIYADKGRGKMADFIYGDVNTTIEKATYIPKDRAVYIYSSLDIEKPVRSWYFTNLYEKSYIRYSQPVFFNNFWNKLRNLVTSYSKFGSEFDYTNQNVKYKKTPLK